MPPEYEAKVMRAIKEAAWRQWVGRGSSMMHLVSGESSDYQLGNLCRPGLSHGLTCEEECPRVTVRDRSSPRLWPAKGPASSFCTVFVLVWAGTSVTGSAACPMARREAASALSSGWPADAHEVETEPG
jgi:hypothetical protein